MPIDLKTFNEQYKDQLVWIQKKNWSRGQAIKQLVWAGHMKDPAGTISTTPSFMVDVTVDHSTGKVFAGLYANTKFIGSPQPSQMEKVDSTGLGYKSDMSDEFVSELLRERYGMAAPSFGKGHQIGVFEKHPVVFNNPYENILLHETLFNHEMSTITNVYLTKKQSREGYTEYRVDVATVMMSQGMGSQIVPQRKKPPFKTLRDASVDFYHTIRTLKAAGCQEGDAPKEANSDNWDFQMKVPKEVAEAIKRTISGPIKSDDNPFEVDSLMEFQSAALGGIRIKAQDYSSWEHGTGPLPDPSLLESKIGSPDVDMNQIKSYLSAGIVDNAKKMVDMYSPGMLTNIAFIWSLSDQSAFGVYVPAIDQAIKEERVKRVLKQKGYQLEDLGKPGRGFTAMHPKKSQAEIDQEVKATYQQFDMMPGTNFGINVNKIVAESQQDAQDMVQSIKSSGVPMDSQAEQEIINGVQTIHLAGTIVHEATHAMGATSEGPAEQAEMGITNKLLEVFTEQQRQKAVQRAKSGTQPPQPTIENPQVQAKFDEYVKQMFPQFHATKGASSRLNWFGRGMAKSAQYGAQFMTVTPRQEQGPAPWVAEKWDAGVGPIESMLGGSRRNTPFTNNNSLERQMREIEKTKWTTKLDSKESSEELLERDRKHTEGYKTTEQLMEDRRVKPLMVPVKKSSVQAKPVKLSYFLEGAESELNFGALSNVMTPLGGLDHPISERILTGPRADADLFHDWEAIRKLPRYNPEYDSNGMFATFKEWQFQPETWEQVIEERTRFMSGARVASTKDPSQSGDPKVDTVMFAEVLACAEAKIKAGEIKGTNFVCDDKVVQKIVQFFETSKGIRIDSCDRDGRKSVWVVDDSINEDKVAQAEQYASGQSKSSQDQVVFDYISGMSQHKKQVVMEIIGAVEEACKRLGVEDVYVVGGFPRSLAMNESWSNIRDLDFSGAWPTQSLKVGGVVAESLGVSDVEIYHRTMTMSWKYMGIKCDFKGSISIAEARDLMRADGIDITPLSLDVYSRDFTMNMFVYSLKDHKVYDVTSKGMDSLRDKVIRTYFDPDVTIPRCPLNILRAIKYAVRYGFKIDKPLSEAMLRHAELLFDGRYSDERLEQGSSEIMSEGQEKASKLLELYHLDRLFKTKGL